MMYAFSTDANANYPLLAAACMTSRYHANYVERRKPQPDCRTLMVFRNADRVDLREALETVYDDAVVMGW